MTAAAQAVPASLRDEFPGASARTYVDTANYGLPPRATTRALERALARWTDGSADWLEWDPAGDECRELFARIVSCSPDDVALMPAASVGAGLVAGTIAAGDEVLVPDDEFRSLLFPLLAAARARGASVRAVPFAALADEVGPRTTLVATSHVRSNGGGRQDVPAVLAAAREHGARVVVDATHAAGAVDVDLAAVPVDFLVVAAYKHLLCPRGVGFLYVAREHRDAVVPAVSSWRSVADPYGSYYGGDLGALAPTAARFDVSLAWHAWVGARESLALVASLDGRARERHAVGLANLFAERLGVPATGSSIVGFPVPDVAAAKRRLGELGVVASFPRSGARVSFHVYNDESDVDAAVAAFAPLLQPRQPGGSAAA